MATDTDTEPMMQASTTFAQSSNSTRQVLNRFDLDGDGIISQSEANLMANANVSEQNEKKSKSIHNNNARGVSFLFIDYATMHTL